MKELLILSLGIFGFACGKPNETTSVYQEQEDTSRLAEQPANDSLFDPLARVKPTDGRFTLE